MKTHLQLNPRLHEKILKNRRLDLNKILKRHFQTEIKIQKK